MSGLREGGFCAAPGCSSIARKAAPLSVIFAVKARPAMPKATSTTCAGNSASRIRRMAVSASTPASTRSGRHVRQDRATGARVSASRARAAPQSFVCASNMSARVASASLGGVSVVAPSFTRSKRSGRAVAIEIVPSASWQGTASALSATSRGIALARRGSGGASPSVRMGAPWTRARAFRRVGSSMRPRLSRMRPSGRSSSRAVASVASASASEIAPVSIRACARMASALCRSTSWGRLGSWTRCSCGAIDGPPGRTNGTSRGGAPSLAGRSIWSPSMFRYNHRQCASTLGGDG
jgi:hypothetical protein